MAGRESSTPPQAGVAQLVEQLIRNQQVSGSSPLAGSIRFNNLAQFTIRRFEPWMRLGCVLDARPYGRPPPDWPLG